MSGSGIGTDAALSPKRPANGAWPSGAMDAAVTIFGRRLNKQEMRRFLGFTRSVFEQGAKSARTIDGASKTIDWTAWRSTP